MNSLKTLERIGIGLYIIAIILLLTNIFQKGADSQVRYVESAGWILFAVASLYTIWIKKKKDTEKK